MGIPGLGPSGAPAPMPVGDGDYIIDEIDSVAPGEFFEYEYLSGFKLSDNNLLQMGDANANWQKLSPEILSSISYNPSTLYFPLLGRDILNDVVVTEDASFTGIIPSTEYVNEEIGFINDALNRYETKNINSYFLTTSHEARDLYSESWGLVLSRLSDSAKELVKSLENPSWGINLPTSIFLEVILGEIGKNIVPSPLGREVHQKIKSETLKIDNFIISGLRGNNIGKIDTSVIRERKSAEIHAGPAGTGLAYGDRGTGRGSDGDDAWWDVPWPPEEPPPESSPGPATEAGEAGGGTDTESAMMEGEDTADDSPAGMGDMDEASEASAEGTTGGGTAPGSPSTMTADPGGGGPSGGFPGGGY
tara:strand:+ start:8762 stop:9847 length:1086 start_codon:yes stop_codon:yes gene_type:complete